MLKIKILQKYRLFSKFRNSYSPLKILFQFNSTQIPKSYKIKYPSQNSEEMSQEFDEKLEEQATVKALTVKVIFNG